MVATAVERGGKARAKRAGTHCERRNAARNVYWYGEERRKDTTRGEIGEQGHAFGFVPVRSL
jgi:hypothetical protein